MSASEAEAVLETLRRIAHEKLGADPDTRFTRESRLAEDLALDSIRLLTLAMAVEDHFLICLDEHDEMGLATVGDLVDMVVAKSAAKPDSERSLDG